MDATIAQQPKAIGDKAIKAVGTIVNDETIDEFIPVELQMVTE